MSSGYSKGEVVEAVRLTLLQLSVQGGGYVRLIKLHKGEPLPKGLMDEALQMPALFVSYAFSTYGPGQYLHTEETLHFNISAVCRAGSAPDVFKVLEDVRDTLCGSTLGLEVMPARLVSEAPVFESKEASAFKALYSITQKVLLNTLAQNT